MIPVTEVVLVSGRMWIVVIVFLFRDFRDSIRVSTQFVAEAEAADQIGADAVIVRGTAVLYHVPYYHTSRVPAVSRFLGIPSTKF